MGHALAGMGDVTVWSSHSKKESRKGGGAAPGSVPATASRQPSRSSPGGAPELAPGHRGACLRRISLQRHYAPLRPTSLSSSVPLAPSSRAGPTAVHLSECHVPCSNAGSPGSGRPCRPARPLDSSHSVPVKPQPPPAGCDLHESCTNSTALVLRTRPPH